jgi:TolB protein
VRWWVFLTLVFIVMVPTALATLPGKDGRIAYQVKDSAGHWQIWVANSDLSSPRQITRGRYDSGWAVWSPAGKRLALDSNRTDHRPQDSRQINDVFVMNADGSDVRKLTDSKGVSGDPAWSPDGSLIAFDADRGNAIYLVPADGGKLRRVTHPRPPWSDYKPRFSPDGGRLIFARARGTADHAPAALFTERLDGSGLHRLTPYVAGADDPDWSPDGKRIVFEAYPHGPYGDIYVVDATGGKPVNLTRNPVGKAGSADAVWAPDGSKILFLDNRVLNGLGRTGLATMKPDGSDRQFILSDNVEAHQADWQSSH